MLFGSNPCAVHGHPRAANGAPSVLFSGCPMLFSWRPFATMGKGASLLCLVGGHPDVRDAPTI